MEKYLYNYFSFKTEYSDIIIYFSVLHIKFFDSVYHLYQRNARLFKLAIYSFACEQTALLNNTKYRDILDFPDSCYT